MEVISGVQLIAGEESAGGATFLAYNPRTRQPSAHRFYEATTEQVERAASAASAAFEQTRLFSSHRLAGFLDGLAAAIEELGDQLLAVADEETALGVPRLSGERDRTTTQLRKFAALLREGSYVEAVIDSALPDRLPAPRPSIRRMLQAFGPVAVFPAGNFPFAFGVAGGDTASAFAAACPAVVKAHPGHPATSELFARAIYRAIAREGFPPGFFSLIQGREVATGQALVNHPAITAVGFTGSLRAGRAIFDAAAARPTPIPVFAEMGSVNPLVILPGAIEARAAAVAEGLVNSVTLGAGQFCTNPGLVFVVDSPQAHSFIKLVTERMAAAQPGLLLNAQVESGLSAAVARTTAVPGMQRLTGGEVVEGGGYCYANTVLQVSASAFRENPRLQEEHFGPVTLFVVAGSRAELLETLRFLGGNLTASIHAGPEESEPANELVPVLREKVGRIIWNGFPTGVEVVYAMQHGGPYPATTAPASTSVGMAAIKRFLRPVAYQGFPDELLPPALQDANPLGIWRVVDERLTRVAIGA